MTLQGKVVLVTGASRGIGRAYLTALADQGAEVVALARSFGDGPTATTRPETDPASTEDDTYDARPLRLRCDVAQEAEVVSVVERIATRFGRIDVLVNNAGIFPHHPPLATSVENWDEMMRVNVRGLYLMIREVAPHMVRQGRGNIVNMSSGSALPTDLGAPGHTDLMAYGVSKAAVDRITTYLAEELRPSGVAVNGLRPGGVLTDTWRAVAPADWTAALEGGYGQRCVPEVVGPPLVCLAQQTVDTMTGQIVAAREFALTWP